MAPGVQIAFLRLRAGVASSARALVNPHLIRTKPISLFSRTWSHASWQKCTGIVLLWIAGRGLRLRGHQHQRSMSRFQLRGRNFSHARCAEHRRSRLSSIRRVAVALEQERARQASGRPRGAWPAAQSCWPHMACSRCGSAPAFSRRTRCYAGRLGGSFIVGYRSLVTRSYHLWWSRVHWRRRLCHPAQCRGPGG